RPTDYGKIVTASKFHTELIMSVVAKVEPLFQFCINCTEPDTDSKKIPPMIDPSGLCPSAASSAAFKMQNAASTGISRTTTTFETKPVKLVSTLFTHALLMFP